ncbi:sodium/proton antiporter, CPA1 family [Peptoclostridium litorale DSM 5388]|uniref:Potassium transporter n=1 Tax=Peptoclostridium litorale DSM 5388 TaxID=1121324 RepID=A0A069RKU0_PEPLI|nr:cation:proton antiporter [Peptoclostridium litorale]KDR96745.1 potassium transporter [Peptoclostridium litorale DSM 5388]SIN67232.1 sodium/proton antiporter, CPA1 family [Peptoclostridium litorale DSM 5388]
MITSVGIILAVGILAGMAFEKLRLPGLLGMLITGVVIGPYGMDIISPDLLGISSDIRKIALVVILLRAGLGIRRDTLARVGVPAMKMSCIPGILEGVAITFVASALLGIPKLEAAIMGFIIAAVSPAVVVPQMISLIDRRLGDAKGIPTLILAGASIDDIFAITVFSSLLGIYSGKGTSIAIAALNIPLSIIFGAAAGAIAALAYIGLGKKLVMPQVKKIIILLSMAFLLTGAETLFEGKVPFSSFIGIMFAGFVILERIPKEAIGVAQTLSKIWIFAEVFLFVLVGAQVDVHVAMDAGVKGILIIIAGLAFRSVGVMVSLIGTNLNTKERLFCAVSYVPKATVQAAIGAVPLSAGVASGDLILAMAVLSIVLTAPIGAAGIKFLGERWLEKPAA